MTMKAHPPQLAATLTIGQAIGLALCMVIGSGLLVLPGLAYLEVGSAAVYAWALNAAVVLPLLCVFGFLGGRCPSAAGVSGYAQAAFSRPAGAASEILLLGACALGGAAMAISGGNYLSSALNSAGGRAGALAGAFAIVGTTAGLNAVGARLTGRVQQIVSWSLVVLVVAAAASALILGRRGGMAVAPLADLPHALPAVGLVFFAFTGWELFAATAEEFKRPRRDFPIAIAISFAVVVLLYLAVALAVQLSLPPDHPQLATAPIAAILSHVFGAASGRVAAALGVCLIISTLVGGTWATSRMIFASAREGLLPGTLAIVHDQTGTPRRAVLAAALVFASVVALHGTGVLSLRTIFQLSGTSFFVSYLLAALCYMKLAPGWWRKSLGLATLAGCFAVLTTFGWSLLYPALCLLFGLSASLVRTRAPSGGPAHADLATPPVR
jgi:amino acid efflux transporter